MELQVYLDTIGKQLASELTPILEIKEVTSNTDLLGKYTEASVRSLVRRIVHPMHVCTGAVLDHPVPNPLRQIDLIVWAPFPAPAIFEGEGFGLVPRSSAFGVIEVKRSNYNGVEDQLEQFLANVDTRKIEADPGGVINDYEKTPGMGVISVLEASPSTRLQSLIDLGNVVAIFERKNGGTHVRSRDVLCLVNFLQYVTWRYRTKSSALGYPQIVMGQP